MNPAVEYANKVFEIFETNGFADIAVAMIKLGYDELEIQKTMSGIALLGYKRNHTPEKCAETGLKVIKIMGIIQLRNTSRYQKYYQDVREAMNANGFAELLNNVEDSGVLPPENIAEFVIWVIDHSFVLDAPVSKCADLMKKIFVEKYSLAITGLNGIVVE